MARSRAGLFTALALVLALCVAGCAATSDTQDMDQRGGGGTPASAGANLREVTIEEQGDKTLVHMSFVGGSRYSDVEETKLTSVPEYELVQLDSPPRLEVRLHTRFADYAEGGQTFSSSVVRAVFDCALTGSTLMDELFLQLDSPVDVEKSEDGAILTLTLSPRQAPEGSSWHVGLNAMDLYTAGSVPADLGFAPTLCSDLSSQILISAPLASKEEAEELMEQSKGSLPASLPDSAMYVFELGEGQLPPYEEIEGSELAEGLDVLEVDGVATPLPVLLDNGRYLCTAPDGTVAYSTPYVPDGTIDEEETIKEEVWLQRPDGSREKSGAGQMYDITGAAFSPDGRYLALSDMEATGQILFVWDTQDGVLRNIGEEGFGNNTVSFVWDPAAPVLYAMTGTGETLQLQRYDFAAADGNPHVSSVEERNGSDSRISYADGHLYFADQSDQTAYSVDIATGQRTALGRGVQLALSDDGAYMAVLAWADGAGEAEDTAFNLTIADARTGEAIRTVLEGVQVSDFFFGADSDSLYLTTQSYEGVSDEYPFALLRYAVSSGVLQLIGYSRTESVLPSATPGQLCLIYYFPASGSLKSVLPVTYAYSENN